MNGLKYVYRYSNCADMVCNIAMWPYSMLMITVKKLWSALCAL